MGRPSPPIVMGDLNMNTDAQNPAPKQLHSVLAQRGCRQRVGFITRPPRGKRPKAKAALPDRRRGSCLDHVWCDQPCACSPISGLSQLSEHRGVRILTANYKKTPAAPKKKWIWRRNWDEVDVDDAGRILLRALQVPAARPHEAAEAAEEMRRRGVGDAPHPSAAKRAISATTFLKKWNDAWEKVKREGTIVSQAGNHSNPSWDSAKPQ